MASNSEAGRQSGSLSSKRGRQSGKKDTEPKVRQRGLGIARLEFLRVQNEMAAAGGNVAGVTAVPNQLQNGLMVQNPYFLSPRPPVLHAPVTTPPQPSTQGRKMAMEMSMDSGSFDLGLGLSTRQNEGNEFPQPNYFTNNLLVGEDCEEHDTKKAPSDSSGAGSLTGSSSGQEPDLELRL